MNWFTGEVLEAITLAKSKKAIFVVVVIGKDNFSHICLIGLKYIVPLSTYPYPTRRQATPLGPPTPNRASTHP